MISNLFDFIANNASIIIALCALAFTAYQVFSTRRHNKLTNKPHLTTFDYSNQLANKSIEFCVKLMNNGLGPALIKKYEILLDNKKIDTNDLDHIDSVFAELSGLKYSNRNFVKIGKSYWMPAKEKLDIFRISFLINSDDEVEKIKSTLNRFDILIEYESIYGEKMAYSSILDKKNR